MDLTKFSASRLAVMLSDGKISASELAELSIERINKIDSGLGAFVTVDESGIRSQALQADALLAADKNRSPLTGLPLAIKDNISTAGIRTTCASKMLADYVPPYSATVVEKLRKSGAVIAGKSNLDEFAMGSTTETSAWHITRNPWSYEHVPGGSSGGSAAAVAAGLVPLALGSDTGGSIRQPCSYCGLTGLKPTYGTVSRYGLIAYASSLDQIGPIARTSADCALVYTEIAGTDGRDSTSMIDNNGNFSKKLGKLKDDVMAAERANDFSSFSLAGKRIAVPKAFAGYELQQETAEALEQAIRVLEQAGAVISECELPLLEESIPAYYLIASAEASANLSRYDGVQYGYRTARSDYADLAEFYSLNRAEALGPEVRTRIMLGTFALSSGYYDAWYLKAQKIRRLIRSRYNEILTEYDFILGPTAPRTAPLLGVSLDDPLAMYLSDVFTVGANLTGLPALALPCGFDNSGLPIGLQLTGRAYADDELLRAGIAWQQQTEFHLAQPSDKEAESAVDAQLSGVRSEVES